MNGHLSLLRSLMPSFYVKRGDQASIIGGVVEYIKELQQVLQSLEAKKQRKAYTEEPSPTTSSSSSSNNIILNDGDNTIHELVAKSRSSVADVEVKFSGANLVVKTVSYKIPGQVVKIISALEDMCLEILHVSINGVDDTMHNSFTIKIGVECQLSAEELAQQIQRTFC
ncbi:Transcription factor MUTE [Linum grandiflorum]